MQPTSNPPKDAKTSITWQAPEYVRHHHSAGWYSLLTLGTVVLAAGVYLILKDIFATVIIGLLGAIVGIAASHQPKLITYQLSASTLTLNNKPYALRLYKSFSVADEGELVSATLMPLKRFMLPLAIYFTDADADRVVNGLSASLAHDDRPADAVERLATRLRF